MRFAFRIALIIAGCLVLLLSAVYQHLSVFDDINTTSKDGPVGIFKFPKAVLQWVRSANASQSSSAKANVHLKCSPKQHFAFLKVPKAGSSTVQNIFYRYGTLRWLKFALPTYANYISRTDKIRPYALIPPPTGEKYDVMCNHVMYNRSTFSSLMHDDALYIGIIREPLPQLESYIYYYHYKAITQEDKLTEYLQNSDKYIRQYNMMPNPQTDYYGLSPLKRNDPSSIRQFISKIDKEFDFIILLERFDESMLLLKRRLCWSLTDVLYVRKNTNFANPRLARSHTQKTKHKFIALAEYYFYEHFQLKLIGEIVKEGIDFQNELDHYRGILRSVNSFCLDPNRQWGDKFFIPVSAWNGATNISAAVCYLMMLPELKLQELVGRRQYGDQRWKSLHQSHGSHNRERVVNRVLPNGVTVRRRYFNAKLQNRDARQPEESIIRRT